MAPARTADPDADPITASYDVYLTPPQTSQVYLLQYPNRARDVTYSQRHESAPRSLRMKPNTGYIEVDIPLNTEGNFNRYAGLKWGGSLNTAKKTQNASSTFGLAAGLAGPTGGAQQAARSLTGASEIEREHDIANGLQRFARAEMDGDVMEFQTLGGQVVRHTGVGEEEGKPWYFVGAFKGDQLHLTRVEGTAQMRPQFHHVDAETQREHLLKVKGGQGAATEGGAPDVRAINQRVREAPGANPKGDLEAREAEMEKALLDAREEAWVDLRYVDEDEDEAFDEWGRRMFMPDVETAERLKSCMDDDGYLDAISAPGKGSPTRRRRRRSRKDRDGDEEGEGEADDEVMVDADGTGR